MHTLREKDLSDILDHIPSLVLILELDGTILFCNRRGQELLGYTSSEIVGKPVWVLYSERSEIDFRESLQVIDRDYSFSIQLKGKKKDNSILWLNMRRKKVQLDNGKSLILESASDISLLKTIGEELEKSRAEVETILETAVEGIIIINKKGIIQDLNKTAKKLFGYKSKEVIGENVKMLMPSPYHEEHDQYLENYLATGERKIIGKGREVRGRRKDGSIFPMELAVSEIKLNDDILFSGFIKDISDRRKLENEILNITENERRRIGQELHDGIGQMLSGINLIGQNLARKLKANGVPGADEVREIADMIKEADQYARNLAHGLAHIELENEGLNIALGQLCNRFQNLSNVECEFKYREDCEINKTASLHLYRISQEAINNAIKHGQASKITISLKKNDGYLQLVIEDDGIGFEKTEYQRKNQGMGISTMRHRAHILGGNLNINGKEKGTQIVCTIPLTNIENTKK